VATGYECGIKVDGFEQIQEGDVMETYRLEAVAKKLA
jgi:translation initiation factor IF-2